MKFPRNPIHYLISSILVVLSGLVVVACQKPTTDIVQESKEAPKTENPVPDLTQICQNLKNEMLAINPQRTTLAIEQVNQDIRMCLPLLKSAEQMELMHQSKKMYQQFLQIDRTSEQQQAFENYVLDQAAYPTIQQNKFEQLNLRDQYLLRHKGQAYIELTDQTEDAINYRRSPQYLAKVFAPYLQAPEQVFIENLAEQNAQPLFKNNKLNLEPDEIAKRAKFWQEYLVTYPNTIFLHDARFLKNAYSSLLFLGTEGSPISMNFENQNDIDTSSWLVIEHLSKTNEGELSVQAKKFIQFVQMTPEQRQQKIQISEKERLKLENRPQLLALSQLNQYLNLSPIDFKHVKKDCFSDAICSNT
ncbi:hypothetical protein [Acinetobacter bereziniae]|uniref:hypothetical protein n=1 Tax=Acinetobacter bereziniae TaxID=106648 RepID=UPI001900B842|nr:hypothetical protein [Acinetobacter bereziniae]MBJ8552110.1 hypothetical protein [Acinetobacter bereziniae]